MTHVDMARSAWVMPGTKRPLPVDFEAAVDAVCAASRKEISSRGHIEPREQFAGDPVVKIADDEA